MYANAGAVESNNTAIRNKHENIFILSPIHASFNGSPATG